MTKLRLLLGPAGSGKTSRVVDEITALAVADRHLADPRDILHLPPLLLLVPEQQAISMEHRLLASIAARSAATDGPVAVSRVRVLSLSRLGRMFESALGSAHKSPSEIARRMLVWRLNGPGPGRDARADAAAGLLQELELYGVPSSPEAESAAGSSGLLGRAAALSQQARQEPERSGAQARQRLADKLRWLGELQHTYRTECQAKQLAFEPAYTRITPAAWAAVSRLWQEPWDQARVWVDGFAGLTPAEERAFKVILQCSQEVTATVLLDRERLEQPLPGDPEDWYQPTRELYRFWVQAAAATSTAGGVDLERHWLPVAPESPVEDEPAVAPTLPRWPAGHPLALVARHGLNPAASATPPATPPESPVCVAACRDERAEVECCCRQVVDWVQQLGYRFQDISIITRNLEPYADLLQARFTDYGIPHFIDRRVLLVHHPVVEHVRCLARLALRLAREPDLYALLKTGLLFVDEQQMPAAGRREILDELERFSRWLGLKPWDWLGGKDWVERFGGLRDPGFLKRRFDIAQLDIWRRAALQVLADLARRIEELRQFQRLSVGSVADALGEFVLTSRLEAELAEWDAQTASAGDASPVVASRTQTFHQRVLTEVRTLLADIKFITGDLPLAMNPVEAASPDSVSPVTFVQWLEYGLKQLTLGLPPHGQDSVLVTDIVRGRQLPVRAAIVLGLAEDTWPAPARQTPLLSDWERAVINNELPARREAVGVSGTADTTAGGPLRLVGAGSRTAAEREPYLALVALTRPAERLLCLYPQADTSGRERFPSRYVNALIKVTGAELRRTTVSGLIDPAVDWQAIFTPSDLALAASLGPQRSTLEPLYATLVPPASAVGRARAWAQAYAGAPPKRPMPGNTLAAALAPSEWLARLLPAHPTRISPSQLEMCGMCSFKHYANYWLKLLVQEEEGFGSLQVGLLYHRVLQQAFQALIQQAGDPRQVPEVQHFAWREFHRSAMELLDREIDVLAGLNGRQRLEQIRARGRLLLGHLARHTAELLERDSGRYPRCTELDLSRSLAQPAALSIEVGERRFEISGFIDRLDADAQGRAVVVDYKLTGRQFDLWRLKAGVNLQMCLYLLALREARLPVAGGELSLQPIRAELHRLEPKAVKGELVFKETAVPAVSGTLKKEEQVSLSAGTLLIDSILNESEQAVTALLERITRLEIAPVPLRSPQKNWTACSGCSFRPLCRFDPAAGEPYREAPAASMREWQKDLLAANQGGRA